MATIIRSVGAGKNYPTLSALVNAISNQQDGMLRNFTTNTDVVIAEIYDSIEDSVLIPSNWVTNANYYFHIRPAPKWKHVGYRDFGARIVGDGNGAVIELESTPYVLIEDLILTTKDGDSNNLIHQHSGAGGNVLINRCLLLGETTTSKNSLIRIRGNSLSSGPVMYVLNSLFYASNVTSTEPVISLEVTTNNNGVLYIANCTILGSEQGRRGGTPVGPKYAVKYSATGGTSAFVVARNVVCVNMSFQSWFPASTGGTESISGSRCFSDDASSVSKIGNGSTQYTAAAMYLAGTAQAMNEDGHLLDSSPLKNLGQNPATSVTTVPNFPPSFEDRDIRGELRNASTWSAGAHQHKNFLAYRGNLRQTDVPLGFVDLTRGATYDGPERSNRFNKFLYRLDRMLTEDDSENDRIGLAVTSAETTIIYQRPNYLPNAGFERWILGTSFTSREVVYTADSWSKSVEAKVTQVSAPSGAVVDYGLKLESLDIGATVYVQQKLRWRTQDDRNYITVSIDVSCGTANTARIGIKSSGDTTFTYSSYHTGSGNTERLTITVAVADTDTSALVRLFLTSSPAGASATFFQGMMVFESVATLPFVPADPSIDLLQIYTQHQFHDYVYAPTSELAAWNVSPASPYLHRLDLPIPLTVPVGVEPPPTNVATAAVVYDSQLTEGGGLQPSGTGNNTNTQTSSINQNDETTFLNFEITFRSVDTSPPKSGNTLFTNVKVVEYFP